MNETRKNILFLFTSRYPGGAAESFIEPELELLSPLYSEIHVFPLIDAPQEVERSLPANVILHKAFVFSGKKISVLSPYVIKIIFSEFFHSKNKFRWIANFRMSLRNLFQSLQRANAFNDFLSSFDGNITLYSFWMEDWVTTLSLLKQRNKKINFYCKTHGYDLYEYRRPEGFIPWRYFQLKNVSAVFAVSNAGHEYLTNLYPYFSKKIQVNRLGILSHGIVNPIPKSECIHVVSCANVVKVKRVLLLLRRLHGLSIAIKWVHFGDGPLFNELEKESKVLERSPLEIILKGSVSKAEIMEWYKTQPVDMFIHLSDSEGGVPLALQEAVSCGIPVLACSTGGVVEIVNQDTGVLLPIEHSQDMFEKSFNEVFMHFSRNEERRSVCRQFWKENFDLSIGVNALKRKFDELNNCNA